MRVAIIGSTGSIGVQTLDICRRFTDRIEVVALAGGRNTALLGAQLREFRPRWVASLEPVEPALLQAVGARQVALNELAALGEVDRLVLATTGRAGLEPAVAAIEAKTDLIIANKEVLVMAGGLVRDRAARNDVRLLPVDSEHNAIWQCLQGDVADYRSADEIEKVLLTASGGAFRHLSPAELESVTVEQALQHPNWVMGPKVTVDSATLMNKGFEVIETHWLFGVPYGRIEIVLHRESLIHSMVQFADGAIKAQLSPPDMRLPIQYALSYPERWENPSLPRVDFSRPFALHFDRPDPARYPCLQLALDAARAGGTMTAVLSAADEWAVAQFLGRRIGFTDIPGAIAAALEAHAPHSVEEPTLEAVLEAERATVAFLDQRLRAAA